MKTIDKHGEQLAEGDRVMVDGGLVGTVKKIAAGEVLVDVDGNPPDESAFSPSVTVQTVDELESLGDGINQAMRAAQGQPN